MKLNTGFFLTTLVFLIFSLIVSPLQAADDKESDQPKAYDPIGTVVEHISDANEYHVWKGVHLPLPVILYAPDKGWDFFLSSKFEHGHKAINRYVLHHGRVYRIKDSAFPMGEVELGGHGSHGEEHDSHSEEHDSEDHADESHGEATHGENGDEKEADKGKKQEVLYAYAKDGSKLELERASKFDGGLLGYGITSFYDFSITKNVFSMFIVAILLFLVFTAVARGYKRNKGKAPSGIQSLMEPIFVFIRDEVTRPMIGEKHYERFQPFIMTLFFFILFCNLLGLIPFFPGSANITGNIAVTMVLAVITFIITNINGNKHYWEHTLWMPGIPAYVKLIILTPVEVLGLFIKPFSLMIRLFANITAGHIIILSLIGLTFLFGSMGTNPLGAGVGALLGGLFAAFMNLIELIVAFVQAFIFAILAASYIGAAVEEGHHDHDEAHAH